MNSYRGLLLELSNSLTSSDLEGLKFLCRDVIPAGRAERITRPFEFFAALEQLNMLSEENRDFLASKLIAINRNDLRNQLLGIQGMDHVNVICHMKLLFVLTTKIHVAICRILHDFIVKCLLFSSPASAKTFISAY